MAFVHSDAQMSLSVLSHLTAFFLDRTPALLISRIFYSIQEKHMCRLAGFYLIHHSSHNVHYDCAVLKFVAC